MNKIGSFGPVVFVVSREATRTFDELRRTASSRWAKHELIGKKPLTQYIGPGLDTVSFTMRFLASARINPRKEMDALIKLERSGKAVPLIIGGKGMGTGLWIITGLDLGYEKIDARGNVIVGSASISLEEYVVKKK